MALNYYRKVRTTAKGRWYNKKLRDIVEEFGPSARIIGDVDHTIVPKDFVEYEIHVHEPSVPALLFPDAIIAENADFLVINKPSGIPVHPTVNYYHHSITEMLAKKYGAPLFPCYRLDRLTSGVLVLGKSAQSVAKFNKLPKHKLYYARVEAESLPSLLTIHKQMTITDPIITFNGKRGYNRFLDSVKAAKAAESRVGLLGIDSATKLATLQIEPVTGRTHQIRKHLALHGMPIHNDEVYFDGGRFRALCKDPSEANFASVWEFAEQSRVAKLTGEHCEECGQELYNRSTPVLDLHCALYEFGDNKFTAPAPF